MAGLANLRMAAFGRFSRLSPLFWPLFGRSCGPATRGRAVGNALRGVPCPAPRGHAERDAAVGSPAIGHRVVNRGVDCPNGSRSRLADRQALRPRSSAKPAIAAFRRAGAVAVVLVVVLLSITHGVVLVVVLLRTLTPEPNNVRRAGKECARLCKIVHLAGFGPRAAADETFLRCKGVYRNRLSPMSYVMPCGAMAADRLA